MESRDGTVISRAGWRHLRTFVDEIDLARIALYLVILLLICSATRKALTIPHDASSGPIARGVCLLWYGTIATPVTSRY